MPKTAREAALSALIKCRVNGAWSDAVVGSVIENAKLSQKDASLCTKLCTGVLQNYSLCDFYINQYSTVKSNKMEPVLLDILRISVYQMVFLDRIPSHAAVNEAVSIIKKKIPRASGLCNAILRRISENLENLPEIPNTGSPEFLSIKYSHPPKLCELLLSEFGFEFTEQLLIANNAETTATAQVNTNKISTDNLLEILKNEGLKAEVSLFKNSIEITNPGDLSRLKSFNDGLFFIQDNAAKLAVETADPKAGMRVLDCCAAPGGKSFSLAIQMENQGEIIACDIGKNKLKRIVESSKRLGIDIIKTHQMDAKNPKEEYYKSFDLVFADVPCSGIGVIRKKPDIRQKCVEDIERLPEIQLEILNGISKCVKPNGTLLYSTCTVFKRENQDVIGKFLENNKNFYIDGEARTLFPHIDGTDGFFICKLRAKNEA